MDLGLIGLGKMGGNMARRLLGDGHRIVVYDRNPENCRALAAEGAVAAGSIADLTARLKEGSRVLWIMVPAGEATEETVTEALCHLSTGDCLVDGGNSHYKDSIRHHAAAKVKGVGFLDAGTSGGIWGLANGYCLMVGGEVDAFIMAQPLLKSLAPPGGYSHVGPAGAGHYAKMVHNGIEYGMMEAIGEGFELLQASGYGYDLQKIALLWQQGSVVRSWLLELLAKALSENPNLVGIRGLVPDSGEGRWTLQAALEAGVPVPAIADALFARFRSRQEDSFSAKVAAALRGQFGGHLIEKITEEGQ